MCLSRIVFVLRFSAMSAAEPSTIQADRSRLLNRQKKERSDLEKDVKKKKGAMKQAAQEELEALEITHAQELAEFDNAHSTNPSSKPTAAPVVAAAPAASTTHAPIDVEWNDLSKKELQEECALRNLSKGGGREELVTRLIGWAAEMKAKGVTFEAEDPDSDSDNDEGSDGSSSDGDIPDMNDEQKLEAEKQYKRETIVRKAILHLFESKFPDGFPLDQLPEYLAKIKVTNFKPESLGYTSLHDFARKQPRDLIYYNKDQKVIKPAAKRGDKKTR